MPRAAIGDAELHYDIHGEGPPLLLVAGLGGAGTYWQPQIAEFSRHFQVIVHDHRGTGRSTRSEIRYSVEQMTADLVALMDHLGIARAHLLGHSTGGAIGQVMAIEHPQRIDRMVIYASWTRSDTFMRRVFETRKTLLRTAGAAAYIKASSFFLFPDWWINDHAATLEEADRATLAGFPTTSIALSRCDAVIDFDRVADLGKIATPTLVFCAEDDFLTPLYFSRQLSELIPGARLATVPRGGHACSQTVPADFAAAVLPFLRGGGLG